MPKLSKDKQDSLNRLNDQLLAAKEKGNSKLVKQLQAIIKAVKSKQNE